jgi:tellurite resistance protein
MLDVELLRAACCVAALDGETTPGERAIIDKLAERAGVGAASLKAMLDMARSKPDFYTQQFRVVREQPEACVTMMLRVAAADGTISQEERVIIAFWAERLGLSRDRFDELLRTAEAGGADA